MQQTSVLFVLQQLDAKLAAVRSSLASVKQMLASNDAASKKKTVQNAIEAMEALGTLLDDAARPTWLTELQRVFNKYLARFDEPAFAEKALDAIIRYHAQMLAFKWPIEDGQAGILAVDFDTVYQKYYEDSRLPSLFEELAQKLAELVKSGHVENTRILHNLEVAIATIRKNQNGSYIATHGALKVAKMAVANIGIELLSEVPLIGAAVRGLEKTFEQMDEEMQGLQARAFVMIESSSAEVLRLSGPPKLLPPGLSDGEEIEE